MNIPMIGFAGFSGSGKTTLIEKLIPIFRSHGLRLAVVKHDGHRFEIDKEGKDSWRFSHAGAEMVILTSREKSAVIEQRQLSLEESLRFVDDVDLILIEGWKDVGIPRVGVCRKDTGKGLPGDPGGYLAIASDKTEPDWQVPVFNINAPEPLAEYLLTCKAQGLLG